MPSTEAPAISFDDEELRRLRELRRAFLRSQGVPPRPQEDEEGKRIHGE